MTPDPKYAPECDIFLGINKGFRNPNVTLWIQPDRKMERVIVLFAHYQVLRTPDENAKLALAIHQAWGYGQLTGGWGDSSKAEALRAYSQVFGVEIQGDPGRVEKAQELVKHWLKGALLTKWPPGSTSPGNARNGCFRRCRATRSTCRGRDHIIRWMRLGTSL
jgi:hypothetical protein